MGEIAEAMINGEMCPMCSAPNCGDCADMGMPIYCSIECAKAQGADKNQVCGHDL